jgi:hypothetical protein
VSRARRAALPWLAELEARVGRAAEALRALAAENARLTARVAELEAAAGAAAAEAAAGAPETDGAGEDAEAWRRERAEVRRRVERLAERLESLLSPTARGD